MHELLLERREEALGDGVVVAVAFRSHRAGDARLARGLAERERHVLGEFNRSSQRSIERSCDEQEEAGGGSGWEAGDALAGASAGGRAVR